MTLNSFLLPLVLLVGCTGTKHVEIPAPSPKEKEEETTIAAKKSGAIRLMTYNVGSFSKYMDNSTSVIAAIIKEADADIVGMNEVDSVNTRHAVNQAKALADAIGGWNWFFGRAMAYRGGAYGNAVITPAKVISSKDVILPKFDGSEQRSLAAVETDRYWFGAAHIDHKSDNAQLEQVKVITQWAESLGTSKPIFFSGDMNNYPDSKTLAAILKDWDLISSTDNTFKSTAPSNCIDYIFHYKKSASVKVLGTAVVKKADKGDVTTASDHLAVYADVQF